MQPLVRATWLLMAGGALCLLPVGNRVRAGFGLVSQAVARLLVWSAVVPVMLGAPALKLEMPWSFPVGVMHFRVDAPGAFFLSCSLPMTLLGAVYAVGYLREYFDNPRHVGVHFGLLNMISPSFILVYTGVFGTARQHRCCLAKRSLLEKVRGCAQSRGLAVFIRRS